MKMLLLDVKNDKVEVVDAKGLQDYYKHIGCEIIEVCYHYIGSRPYCIICDNEGLLKEERIVSARDIYFEPKLVGNLLICGDETINEDFSPLTDDDVEYIKGWVTHLTELESGIRRRTLIITK